MANGMQKMDVIRLCAACFCLGVSVASLFHASSSLVKINQEAERQSEIRKRMAGQLEELEYKIKHGIR